MRNILYKDCDTYNRGYSDGYDDAWHDREFDNECDCGYCSDHDEDGW